MHATEEGGLPPLTSVQSKTRNRFIGLHLLQFSYAFLNSGVPIFNSDGSFRGYLGSAVDVTQHKLAEEALSMVSRKLIEVQESSKLEYLGLAAAANSYCSELCEQQKVEIDLQTAGIPNDVSHEVAVCVFRVLQEALQNAIKHSGSRRFHVIFTHISPDLCMTVRDSGIGFDLAEALKGRGLGLISMQERLKLVGGELSIEPGPGNGTIIRARVPLIPKRSAR